MDCLNEVEGQAVEGMKETAQTVCCPLCGREGKVMDKGKKLYNVLVCKKCYYGFANRRQGAFLIDFFLWGIMLMVGGVLYATLGSFLMGWVKSFDVVPAEVVEGVWIAVSVVSMVGAHFAFGFKDGFHGYSLGKRIAGVQVIDEETGRPIGFWQSFKRHLRLQFYTLLCCFLIWCSWLGVIGLYLVVGGFLCRGYRVGDKWARTKVIWKEYENKHVFVDNTLCGKCGYDLRVTSRDECPECGEKISERKRKVIDEVYGGQFV
ncbi:RDD family protein [Poriferisphaera corsica]|uniref:RDD family protein n=1 Tax=Poriferisphaera corsica TaxID=2528020 RepID=A0A517YYK8_9BACT|nr:RDD family protein [Poriferisphaera corsica]QDU35315.1 RDD family protein [Poriferisphaera corsica]